MVSATKTEHVHVSQMYPNLTGRLLQDQVFQDWRVPRCDPMNTPWYLISAPGGVPERAMIRSAVNMERAMNLTSLVEYVVKAKESGLLLGLGSELWGIPADQVVQIGRTQMQLLTGGTRIEAMYQAHADAPSNAQISATMAAPSPKIILFKQDTPRCVQEYLRDMGNSLNDFAVASTWFETMQLVHIVNTLFEAEKARREAEGLESWSMKALTDKARAAKASGTKGADGYEATYFKFADQLYPKRWSGPSAFGACRAAMNKLQSNSAFELVRQWAQDAVVWTDRRMVPAVVYQVFADSYKLFEQHCPDLIAHVPLLARFAMPTRGAHAVPFIVREKKDCALLSRAFMVLGDDKKMAKQKSYSPTFQPEGGTRRPTLLLDEVMRVLSTCLANVSDGSVDWPTVDNMILVAMFYAIRGSATVYTTLHHTSHPSIVIDPTDDCEVEATASAAPPRPKPKEKAKSAAAKSAAKRRAVGLSKCDASSAPAPPEGVDEEAAEEPNDDEDVHHLEACLPVLSGTKTVINTPLKLCCYVMQTVCKVHKVVLKKVEWEEREAEEEGQSTVAPGAATPAADTADSEDYTHSTCTMVIFLKDKEDNKHSKASAALAAFMRSHPQVKMDVMPLAHSTLASARCIMQQRHSNGDTSSLVDLGAALGKLSGVGAESRQVSFDYVRQCVCVCVCVCVMKSSHYSN